MPKSTEKSKKIPKCLFLAYLLTQLLLPSAP